MIDQKSIQAEVDALLASLEATEHEQHAAKKWLIALETYMDRPTGVPTTAPDITRMAWR